MLGIDSSSRNYAAWLLSCAAAVAPLEAGVVMSLQTTDFSLPSPYVEATRVALRPAGGGQSEDPGLLRMDVASLGNSEAAIGRDHSLIFRGGESSSITVVDHRKQSFSVIDRESMESFGTEVQMMMRDTEMRIGSLPPEQRVIAQRMLESQLGKPRSRPQRPPDTVVKTSDHETKSGLPCVKYEVYRNGEKLREVWVAPSAAVRGGESSLAILRNMSDFYAALVDSFAETVPGLGAGFRWQQHPFEDLQRMEGFPVLTRNFAGGRVKTEIVLRSVEEQQLSAAEFKPPEGYSPATPQ